MGVLTSKLVISLIDRVSAPSKAIANRLQALQAATGRNNARMAAMRGKMVEAGVGAYGLARALASPVKAAKDFETLLEDIGQKAALSGMPLDELGRNIQNIAKATNQLPSDTLKTFDALIGLGLGGKDDAENVDAALKMMPAINKVATAYRASAEDVARSGQAAFSNLKVPAERIERVFDVMARSGKEGAFELKDMATYFPELASVAGSLGMEGVRGVADLAAALQVTRMGAGDASKAATNLFNVLQKIGTPTTHANFEKIGINFRKEMEKAEKAGISPIDSITTLTKKALKKKGVKLGDLFQDGEAQRGLISLMANYERYRKIRGDALGALGEVDADYARRILTFDAALIRLKGTAEDTNHAIGASLTPGLTVLMDKVIGPIIKRIGDFAKANPKLTATILGVTGGLIGLRIAAIAASFAFAWLRGGAILLAIANLRLLSGAVRLAGLALLPFAAGFRAARSAMIGFAATTAILGTGGALKAAGTALLGLLNPIRLVRGAFVALKWAIAGTGIGAIIIGLAAAGKFLHDNWSGVKAMFSGMGKGIEEGLGDALPILKPVIDMFKTLFGLFGDGSSKLKMSDKEWKEAGRLIGMSIGEGVKTAIEWIQKLINMLMSVPGKISGAFSGFGSWLKTPMIGGGGPKIDGARATGGPVRKGGTYLVGENGPELFTSHAAGLIHNTNRTVAALKANAIAASSVGNVGGGGKAGGGSVNNSYTITMTVHGAEGQSPKALAAEVKRIFSEELAATSRASFGDGAY